MKTFEEYIREAVDFRLGGKSKKGESSIFNEEEAKTFEELEKGDIIYHWIFSKYSDANLKAIKLTKLKLTSGLNQQESRYIFNAVDCNDATKIDKYGLQPSKMKSKIMFWKIAKKSCGAYTTFEISEREMLSIAEDWFRQHENDHYDVDEAVDFRFGGKDNKGELAKTFGELEKGDKIYSTRVFHEDGRIKRQTHTFSSFEKDKLGHNYIHYESFINNSFVFDSPQIFDSSATCTLGDKYNWILSTYEMTDEDARRIVKKREEAREEQIYEGVDFRLGGSANKGDSIKTFEELKKGDTAYIYKVLIDMKHFNLDHKIEIEELVERGRGRLGLKEIGRSSVAYITVPEKHRGDTTYLYRFNEFDFKEFYVLTTYKIDSLNDLDCKIDINNIEIY